MFKIEFKLLEAFNNVAKGIFIKQIIPNNNPNITYASNAKKKRVKAYRSKV